jgi:hypothetical protein
VPPDPSSGLIRTAARARSREGKRIPAVRILRSHDCTVTPRAMHGDRGAKRPPGIRLSSARMPCSAV